MRVKITYSSLEKINKYNPITKSWWTIFYIILISLATLAVTIVNIVNGVTDWVEYTPAYLQLAGLISGMFVIKKMNSRDRNYFWYKSFANVVWILNAILLGFWISVIKDLILWFIDFRTYIKWGKPGEDKRITKMTTKEWFFSFVFIGVLIGAVGYPLTLIPADSAFQVQLPLTDAAGTALLMLAVIFNANKRRESKLFFLAFMGVVMVLNVQTRQLVSIVSGVTGIINILFSTVLWYGEYEIQKMEIRTQK